MKAAGASLLHTFWVTEVLPKVAEEETQPSKSSKATLKGTCRGELKAT